jgi:hypothetical protein
MCCPNWSASDRVASVFAGRSAARAERWARIEQSVGTTISVAINRPNFQKRYSVELNNAKRLAPQEAICAAEGYFRSIDQPNLVDKRKSKPLAIFRISTDCSSASMELHPLSFVAQSSQNALAGDQGNDGQWTTPPQAYLSVLKVPSVGKPTTVCRTSLVALWAVRDMQASMLPVIGDD